MLVSTVHTQKHNIQQLTAAIHLEPALHVHKLPCTDLPAWYLVCIIRKIGFDIASPCDHPAPPLLFGSAAAERTLRMSRLRSDWSAVSPVGGSHQWAGRNRPSADNKTPRLKQSTIINKPEQKWATPMLVSTVHTRKHNIQQLTAVKRRSNRASPLNKNPPTNKPDLLRRLRTRPPTHENHTTCLSTYARIGSH